MRRKYEPCGGCGASDPKERCIGCWHPFEPIEQHSINVSREAKLAELKTWRRVYWRNVFQINRYKRNPLYPAHCLGGYAALMEEQNCIILNQIKRVQLLLNTGEVKNQSV